MNDVQEAPTIVVDENSRSLSIEQFCALEGLSKVQFEKLKRLGLAPDEVRVPGMAFRRITAEARREWHEKLERYRNSKAAKLEAERRTARARAAGLKAAKSATHISNVVRGKARSAAKRAAKKVRA